MLGKLKDIRGRFSKKAEGGASADDGAGTSAVAVGTAPVAGTSKALMVATSALASLAIVAASVLASFIVQASQSERPEASEPVVFAGAVRDFDAGVSELSVVNEEMYIDRYRQLHLTCQVVVQDTELAFAPALEGTDVGYVLYGPEQPGGKPYASISAFADADGFVDVVVDFDGLTPYIDDQHVLGAVDDLYSYDVCSVNGEICEHGPKQHAGEAAFAVANWISNESWYHVDYRSWGSREMAANHTGRSPDPAVRERFTWYTSPQVGPDANADGSANYWNGLNWILTHDYSWMGQVWLTMSPGAVYYIDGVEYEAEGVFNFDRNNTIDAIWALTGKEPLIIQTCDGWVYVRVVYGYPTSEHHSMTDVGRGDGLGTPAR